jgi:hypothetical protein
MTERIQPGKWRYWLAGALMVLGVLAFAVFFLSLSSATEDMVQVIVPGEITLDVEEPGDFVIFYEPRSVVDGRTFATGELPGMTIQIVSDATGEPVEITEPSTNVSYSVGGRSGESIAVFSVDEPGDYTMRGIYPEGRTGDEVVLAVGSGSTGAVGAALLIAGFGMVLLIAGIILAVRTYVRRRRARRQTDGAVPGPAPTPNYT